MIQRRQAFVTMDAAIAVAAAVFMVDLLTNLQGAIAVLYIAVPLILASTYSERIILAAAVGCGALATFAFSSQHLRFGDDGAYTRFGVGIAALAVTTFLAVRQKRGAAELESSERRYRTIFHAAGFALWESDWSQFRRHLLDAMSEVTMDRETWLRRHPEVLREGSLLSVTRNINQAAIALFEASSPDELVGISMTGAIGGIPSAAEPGFARLIAGLLEGSDIVEEEMPLRTVEGRRLDVILRAARIQEDEPWSRVLIMAIDETERKEARAKLEQASADLTHAARVSMLGQLAASVAHEVSQPLAAMVAFAGSGKRWLSREDPNLREAEASLEQIAANGKRAADVIARMRSLVRKAPAMLEEVDLARLIAETVALVAHYARAAGIIIVVEQEHEVPVTWADRVQVQQVLVNLLLNAIQAMRHIDDRDRQLTVKLGNGENGMLHIEVSDTGTGISDMSDVFAPFFTTKCEGMGMGLSISRSIVEAHEGSIHARNNPDFGATFGFSLPASRRRRLKTA
jgi:two-component system sensor kinase FixL